MQTCVIGVQTDTCCKGESVCKVSLSEPVSVENIHEILLSVILKVTQRVRHRHEVTGVGCVGSITVIIYSLTCCIVIHDVTLSITDEDRIDRCDVVGYIECVH